MSPRVEGVAFEKTRKANRHGFRCHDMVESSGIFDGSKIWMVVRPTILIIYWLTVPLLYSSYPGTSTEYLAAGGAKHNL